MYKTFLQRLQLLISRKIVGNANTTSNWVSLPLLRTKPGTDFFLDFQRQLINYRWINLIDIVLPHLLALYIFTQVIPTNRIAVFCGKNKKKGPSQELDMILSTWMDMGLILPEEEHILVLSKDWARTWFCKEHEGSTLLKNLKSEGVPCHSIPWHTKELKSTESSALHYHVTKCWDCKYKMTNSDFYIFIRRGKVASHSKAESLHYSRSQVIKHHEYIVTVHFI